MKCSQQLFFSEISYLILSVCVLQCFSILFVNKIWVSLYFFVLCYIFVFVSFHSQHNLDQHMGIGTMEAMDNYSIQTSVMVALTLRFSPCYMGSIIFLMEGGIIGVWFPRAKTLVYAQTLEFNIVFLPRRGVFSILFEFMSRIQERGHSRRGGNSCGRMNNQKVDVVASSNIHDHGSMNNPTLNTRDQRVLSMQEATNIWGC
jgi:hypothetical protein